MIQIDLIEQNIEVDVVDDVVVINQVNGLSVFKNSSFVYTSGAIDFIEGDNITLDVIRSGNKVKVRISSTDAGGSGSGTVTSLSAGNLLPLFTTNVANPTTTPALTFSLTNQDANLVFAGPSVGDAAAPTFRSLVIADLPSDYAAFNRLTAATTTNDIDNANFAQTWRWNTLAGNSGLILSSNSTLAASNLQTLFDVNLSGANANASQTTYGVKISNTHTGTSSKNVALNLSASGGDTNYALEVSRGAIAMRSGPFTGLIYQTTPTLNLESPGTISLKSDATTFASEDGLITYGRIDNNGLVIGGASITTNVILDLQSTTKAFAPPRMTEVQRDAILSPSAGMLIYNTSTNLYNFYNGSLWGAISGTSPLSGLTVATTNNTINNANFTQEWQWNTLAGNSGLILSSNSTAAASNLSTLLEVNMSGANANSNQTVYGIRSIVSNTGTGSMNVPIYASATGGTTNLAGWFENGGVLIGTGTLTSGAKLDIRGTGTSTGKSFRFADSGNTERVSFTDAGTFTVITTRGNHIFGGGWTANGDNNSLLSLGGTVSHEAVTARNLYGLRLSANFNSPSTNQITKSFAIDGTYTINNTGHTWYGIDINPTFAGSQVPSKIGLRITDGAVLIGGTTITADALLDLQSTTKAFIPPRMTTAQRDAIGTPSAGMIIYNTSTNLLNFYNGAAWGAV